jgi:hypothetical protein
MNMIGPKALEQQRRIELLTRPGERWSARLDEAWRRPRIGAVQVTFADATPVAVRSAIERQRYRLRLCYESLLKQSGASPDDGGDVTIAFTISDERVTSARAAGGTPGSLAKCSERELAELRLESSGAPNGSYSMSVHFAATCGD